MTRDNKKQKWMCKCDIGKRSADLRSFDASPGPPLSPPPNTRLLLSHDVGGVYLSAIPSDSSSSSYSSFFSAVIWRSPARALLKPHNARGPVSNLGTCVMNLGKSSAALLVPYSPPSPDPVPLCPEVSIRLEAGNVGIPNKGLHH